MTEGITDSSASASSSPALNNNEEDATHDEQKCPSTPTTTSPSTTSPSSTHQVIRIKTGGSTASAFADMQMNNKTVDDADVMDMLLPWDNYTSSNNKAPPRRRKKGGLKKNTGGGLANSRRQSDPSFDHIFSEEGNAMTSGKNNPIR